MSTNDTKKQMTVEQKNRKNQLAREKRLKDKENLIQLRQKEVEDQIPIEDDSDDYEEDTKVEDTKVDEAQEVVQENPEEKRKKEISEKRRASLAIARSKIKPKSQITKEKDEEIAKIREENEKLKNETLKAKEEKPKIIKKYIIEEPVSKHRSKSVPPRKKRPSAEIPIVKEPKEPSIDYLAQQSYAEQLQARLRRDVYEKVMNDTFM
jgi:hypothetical protein